MTRTLRILAVLTLLSLAGSTARAEYLIHFVESDFQAPRSMKVPKRHSMGFLVPERLPAGSEVCIGFQNDAANANKGRISGVLEIFRGSSSIGRGTVSGRVQGNFFVRCLFTNAALEIGDFVIGDVKMKGLPKLATGDTFAVAVLTFPAGSPTREAAGRAPRPWVLESHDWQRMRAPANDAR